MYCWLLLQIYLCCLCLCSRDTYEVYYYLNNFSNNATVVLEGFRTTFFKSQRPSYSLALIAVASFCAFLSLHQCETNSGPQCCEGFIPLSMEQQSTKSLQITHHFPRTVLLSGSAGTLQLLWVWRQRFIILRRPLPRWLVAGSPAVSTLFGRRVWVVFGLSCYRSTALHSFSFTVQ